MKRSAKIIGLVLAILLLSTTILFSYPSVREGAYTLGQWYNKIADWLSVEKPDAYDFKVHPWLALRAIELFEAHSNGTKLTFEQKKCIILGAIEEDYDLNGTSADDIYNDVKGSIDSVEGDKLGATPIKQCTRAINHFMDNNGEGLHELAPIGVSALTWATADGSNVTRYSKAEELAKSGDKNGWRYLGHVLHLLQDMATPAHVRNDQHAVFGDDNYETILDTAGTTMSELSANYYDLLPSLPAYPVTVIEPKINNFFINLSESTRNNYYSDNSFKKSGYVNPTLTDNGDGYCYANYVPYKQGLAYYIKGKDCNYAKIDGKTVKVMFPDLASKAIAYGAGLIKLFYDSVPNVAQDQYTMSGTIHSGSSTGAVLSGVTVSIAGLTATTSSTGTFSIAGIPAGTYKLSISKSGYDTYTNSAYYINSDKTGLNFYLTKTVVIPTADFPIGTWDAGKWGSFTVTKLVQTSGSANYYSGSITYSTFGTKSVTGAQTGGNVIMLGNNGTTFVVLAQDYGTLNPTVYNFTATVDPSHGGYAVGEYIWGSLIITTNIAGASYNGQCTFTKTK